MVVNYEKESDIRQEICEIGRRIYDRGLWLPMMAIFPLERKKMLFFAPQQALVRDI
ncbi:hypothetical protein [Enterococcus rivorum]|uniref:hypothetical protein n=1 Tax=Enterococcus rivorum TaxID=762845 RepID=UPI00362D62DC